MAIIDLKNMAKDRGSVVANKSADVSPMKMKSPSIGREDLQTFTTVLDNQMR